MQQRGTLLELIVLESSLGLKIFKFKSESTSN
uniref:Uncharacterized protein n=1 Tax=Rhizophora mucronata TaxID=61149 RepID=A0A2P2MIF4_RHIMU